jgi:membrane protein YqaA with SNARE-associated domain
MEALAGLFVSCFAAATLIPLPSEAALFAYLKLEPGHVPLAIAVATLGNTAGGMTTYLVGLLVPERTTSRLNPKALSYVRRFGAPLTFFAWLPLAGDALIAAAGWLRMKWWTVLAFSGAGRLARYVVVAAWAA